MRVLALLALTLLACAPEPMPRRAVVLAVGSTHPAPGASGASGAAQGGGTGSNGDSGAAAADSPCDVLARCCEMLASTDPMVADCQWIALNGGPAECQTELGFDPYDYMPGCAPP